MKVIKAALTTALAVVALVWGAWIVAVPSSLITGRLADELEKNGKLGDA